MLQKFLNKKTFNLFKISNYQKSNSNFFSSFGEKFKDVLETAPQVSNSKLTSTQDRKKFIAENRIKNKRSCVTSCSATENNNGDWTRSHHNRLFTEKEAIAEAVRCFKCADSPCQKACSTGIDIRQFIYQIQNKNYYGAAKTILSDNPLGLSCGALCPVSELCASSCNAHWLKGGTIDIGRLQEFACKVFKEMRVKQIRSPQVENLPESYDTKIALVGCGAASISCATFLARMGYRNVHIYEKSDYSGGLVASEIPANRINWTDLEWEISLMTDLGVKIFSGKEFGKDVTIDSLKKDGYKAFFIGVGHNSPKMPLGNIYLHPNVFNSKTFLPNVCEATKDDMTKPKNKLFQLGGHTVILGIGDTALDCARSAIRMGAKRVSCIFRRGFDDLRANDEIFNPALYEGINFIPYSLPTNVKVENNLVKSIEFKQFMPDGEGKYKETNQKVEIDCDFLITAFGSENQQSWANDLINDKNGKSLIDFNSYQSRENPSIFAGGDIIGTENLVDAVNDGKCASWTMHKYIQENLYQNKVEEKIGNSKFPDFMTEIDLVDISTEMKGMKFENPFGLASAPPTTSYPMIARAFEQGWGFAVVKTFGLEKDQCTNISPRIFKATTSSLQQEASYSNIELISEKKAKYWVQGAKEIKAKFPNKILIGSIMAAHIQEDWEELTHMCNEAGFDAIELNLSCNHGMPDKGMGKACSDSPIAVSNITKWVKSIAKMPVFIKLSPNSSINHELAMSVQDANGDGVTTTNTMYSLMDPTGDGIPYPNVGKENKTHYGGAAGAVLRPIALRVATEISTIKEFKLEMMATGGIINAEHVMAYLRFGGTKVFQICSAVQEQDFTIVKDLEVGVKTLLYMTQRKDLVAKGWKGQSPPFMKMQKLKRFSNDFDLWEKDEKPDEVDLTKVPKLNDLLGKGQDHIHHITQMDQSAQKFPFVEDDLCVNCGKCYMTCIDSGYQAITFNEKTHKPEITPDCTGCGLCVAVCPVPGAITFDKRPYPYEPNRGGI